MALSKILSVFAFFIFLALGLGAPTDLVKRDTTCVSSTPTTFGITNLYYFTPASSNPDPTSISFTYEDTTTSTLVSCSASKSPTASGSTLVGICSGNEVFFAFSPSNNTIEVFENYIGCNLMATELVSGSTSFGLSCYPTEPPIPQGYGTKCQTPGNWAYGTLSLS